MSHPHASKPAAYTHTLRVTVAYDGTKIEVARVRRVAMRAPAQLATPPQGSRSGYWLEVRDAQGALLYYRALHDPLHRDMEAHGDRMGDPMHRYPNPSTKGEFEVLVPDLPGAQSFRLCGPPAGAHPAVAHDHALVQHSFAELHAFAQRGPAAPGGGGTTP
jgi:hypothetical protein